MKGQEKALQPFFETKGPRAKRSEKQDPLRQLLLCLTDRDLTGAVIEIRILESRYCLEPVHRICNSCMDCLYGLSRLKRDPSHNPLQPVHRLWSPLFDFDGHYVGGMFFV